MTPPKHLRVLVARDADHPGPGSEPGLWAAGYAVEVAAGDADAAVAARLAPPDVVLLEVEAFTPGWADAVGRILGGAAWRKPLVAVLPRRVGPGDAAAARAAGVHLFAEGPIPFDELNAVLRRFAALLAGVEGFDPVI